MKLGIAQINKNNTTCVVGNDSCEIISKSSFDVSSPSDCILSIKKYFTSKHVKGFGICLNMSLAEEWIKFDWKSELCTIFDVPTLISLMNITDCESEKPLISILKMVRNIA